MTTPSKPPKTSVHLGVLLPPPVVAERLGMKETTLADRRMRGLGPPFLKCGRLVRYPEALLNAWLAERLHLQGAA